MVEVIRYIIAGIYLIDAIALIILAAMQTKNSNGASGTITGSSSNNFYEQNKGRTKEGRIKRYTIISGIIFAVLAIVLSILFVM